MTTNDAELGHEADYDQKRASGRINVSGLSSNKGTVIDASAGGLRIKGRAPGGIVPGAELDIVVGEKDDQIEVRCELRWIKRHPFRGATFGLSFVDLSEEGRAELFSIIRRSGLDTRCRWNAA